MTSYGRIQFRRDSTADWSSINPILLDGELGLNTTLGLFKIGDGIKNWNALPYFGGSNTFASLIVWDAMTSKPAFIGAGDTATEAREAIDAISIEDAHVLIANLIGAAPAELDTWIELVSAIQSDQDAIEGIVTSLAAKQPLDADLTAIAALTGNDKILYRNSSGVWVTGDLSAAGRALLDDAAATNQRTTLGLAIGSDVQAHNADLAGIAAAAIPNSRIPLKNSGGTWASMPYGAFGAAFVAAGTVAAANTLLVANRNDANTGATVSVTAALTDAQNLITTNNASANKIMIPTNAVVAFPLWSVISVLQLGAGQTTFEAVTPGTTTVRAPNGAKVSAQYNVASVIKIGTDEWVVYGSTAT